MTPEPGSGGPLRIAAVADLHHGQPNASAVPLLTKGLENVDVLLLCGDLTHHGLPEEAVELAKLLSVLHIPILAVLGNHDFHSNQQEEIKRVLKDSPIRLLDGDAVEIRGVGFAGVKGFATGFGKRVLEPWGEEVVKMFVGHAVEEGIKLGSALAQLRTEQRIAMLHYAPVAETCEGEPAEIHPFLGSSRLEEPLNRFQVTAAFHGHAHHGKPEGRTSTGIPVFNVSLPLLRQTNPDSPPYRLYTLDGTISPGGPDGA